MQLSKKKERGKSAKLFVVCIAKCTGCETTNSWIRTILNDAEVIAHLQEKCVFWMRDHSTVDGQEFLKAWKCAEDVPVLAIFDFWKSSSGIIVLKGDVSLTIYLSALLHFCLPHILYISQ